MNGTVNQLDKDGRADDSLPKYNWFQKDFTAKQTVNDGGCCFHKAIQKRMRESLWGRSRSHSNEEIDLVIHVRIDGKAAKCLSSALWEANVGQVGCARLFEDILQGQSCELSAQHIMQWYWLLTSMVSGISNMANSLIENSQKSAFFGLLVKWDWLYLFPRAFPIQTS